MINAYKNKTRQSMVSAISNYSKILKAPRKDVHILFYLKQELVETLVEKKMIPKEAIPPKQFDEDGNLIPSIAAAASFKMCYDFKENFCEEHLMLLRAAGKKMIEDESKDLNVDINELLGKKKVGKVYIDLSMGKEGQLSNSFITMAMVILCQKNLISYEDIKVYVVSDTNDLNDHDCLKMYLFNGQEFTKWSLSKEEQEMKDAGQAVRENVISLDDFFSEEAVMEFQEFSQTGAITT